MQQHVSQMSEKAPPLHFIWQMFDCLWAETVVRFGGAELQHGAEALLEADEGYLLMRF